MAKKREAADESTGEVKQKRQKISDNPTRDYNKVGKTSIGKIGPKKPYLKNKGYENGKGKFSKGDRKSAKGLEEKPEDWSSFKKQKKELKLKRKQVKNNFDVVTQAKKIGELLRRKQLKNGPEHRNKLINDLHNLLKKDGNYAKFVLAHDTARIVQWILKYSSEFIRKEIFKELKGAILPMMQSKYGVFCVKRLLKYGNAESRSQIIEALYGNAVKLASHVISAPYFEYAYSTWATPKQKSHLVQEFYGDMYEVSKDDDIKGLKDIFAKSPQLKNTILGTIKSNLSRILDKNLLDSSLVQTVLCQFLQECNSEDKTELISQMSEHIVIISNSKDGSRAAMQCIWQGSTKNRKVIMKSLKDHLLELCKHEHGHCTVIALLDAADDTVLLNKIIISEILKNAKDLSLNEWGRKVLLWLIVPDDPTYFHPQFIKELNVGKESSTSKKPQETRRKEILALSNSTLLNLVTTEPEFWLSDSKLSYEMLAILKSNTGKEIEDTFKSLAKVITNVNWKLKENDKEVLCIEQAAMHLVLKKIIQHDKSNLEKELPTFGGTLLEYLSDEVIECWIQLNRGCFLLVFVFENNSEDVQNDLKNKIRPHKKQLKKLDSQGAKILLKKIS